MVVELPDMEMMEVSPLASSGGVKGTGEVISYGGLDATTRLSLERLLLNFRDARLRQARRG